MTLLQDVPSASLKSPSVWVLLSVMKYTIFHPLFPYGVRMQSVDGVVHWRYAYLNTPYFVFVLTTQYTFAGDECSKRPVLVYSQWDNKYLFSMNGCVCTRFVLHRSIRIFVESIAVRCAAPMSLSRACVRRGRMSHLIVAPCAASSVPVLRPSLAWGTCGGAAFRGRCGHAGAACRSARVHATEHGDGPLEEEEEEETCSDAQRKACGSARGDAGRGGAESACLDGRREVSETTAASIVSFCLFPRVWAQVCDHAVAAKCVVWCRQAYTRAA